MKRFLLSLIVIVGIFLFFDLLFGWAMEYLFSNAKGGETANEYYITELSNDEVLIFGSSRALHHYKPSILSDSLHVSCYNCGIEGTGIITAYGRWQVIKKHNSPKIVIYDINSFDFVLDDYMKYCYFLRPLFKDTDVKRVIRTFSHTEVLKLYCNLYRYNSRFPQLIKDYFSDNNSLKSNHGYVPLLGEVSRRDNEYEKASISEIDERKLKLLELFIDEITQTGARLIFIYSPYYQTVPINESNTEVIEDILYSKQIEFLDFREDSRFINEPELFNDCFHLNYRGAELFTHIVSEYISSTDLK